MYTVFGEPLFENGNNISHESIDFDITILDYIENSTLENLTGEVQPNFRGMLKNFSMVAIPRDKDDMKNRPGIIFQISGSYTDADGIYGLIFRLFSAKTG